MEGQPWLKLGGKLVEAEVPGTTTEGDERWPQEARQRIEIRALVVTIYYQWHLYICMYVYVRLN